MADSARSHFIGEALARSQVTGKLLVPLARILMWGAAGKRGGILFYYPTHSFIDHNVPLDIAALKQEPGLPATVFLNQLDVQLGRPPGIGNTIY
jgi:hypothetical protein